MSGNRRSRRALLGAGAAVLALAGGGAFAYFTTSGEGTGEAKVENPVSKLEITAAPVEQLAPGLTKADKVTIKNIAASPIHVSTLKAKITGNSKSTLGCETSWFKVSPETTLLGTEGKGLELAAGASTTVELQVSMVDAEVSQNGCKGATVNLHFEAE
jgi:hypothetical protein